MTDLLPYLKGSPVLLAALIIATAALYALERLLALTGPATKLARYWQGRELARLRREAAVRAERRRLQREEESAVMADLRAQVAELTTEVARLRGVVRASEAHHRVMRDWADGLLRAARSAGLPYIDPPATGDQPRIPAPALPVG